MIFIEEIIYLQQKMRQMYIFLVLCINRVQLNISKEIKII